MKICGIICEFNPFHNGHKYLLERAKELSGCDLTVCVMSGYFTQRGDIAVNDKFTRARHAVLGGADCVIELPAAFSTAPAEIFARGAIKILDSLRGFDCLAFGCEDEDSAVLYSAAEILDGENETFKAKLAEGLGRGLSFVKSRAAAFEAAGGKAELLSSPNNILAVEYIRALKGRRNVEILPVKRVGAGYSDLEPRENFSSASAIRANPCSPLVKSNLPDYAYRDFRNADAIEDAYGRAVKLVLSRTDAERLKGVCGCGEGLENLLKSLETLPYDEILTRATSKRYTLSRIKRILCANFLSVTEADLKEFLGSPLYLSPLAVKKERADETLAELAKADFPTVTSGSNEAELDGAAKRCKGIDAFAQSQWQQISGRTINGRMTTV